MPVYLASNWNTQSKKGIYNISCTFAPKECVGNSTSQSKCQEIFVKFGSVMYNFLYISDTGIQILL